MKKTEYTTTTTTTLDERPVFEPPAFLTGDALEIWRDLLPEILMESLAQPIEATALACYCRAVADLAEAQRAIDEHGLVHKTERGLTKNPAVSIKNQALMHIRQFAAEFGFTPASRSRAAFARRQNQHAKAP